MVQFLCMLGKFSIESPKKVPKEWKSRFYRQSESQRRLEGTLRTRSVCINAATLALVDAEISIQSTIPFLLSQYAFFLSIDSKLPIDILKNVIQLAIKGCKAITNYILEQRKKCDKKARPSLFCHR
ncbi:hypothetical protein Ahy_A08g038445 [Arachis hypogaea]|uniref:Uncharacterized protein n=1 Tax=Arachis hypogaea TaxID=3818 RepID=A0A445BTH3_ARAHY|nr:hypothetical protein Ahy_A08g038445 [Arachis hypogaea]